MLTILINSEDLLKKLQIASQVIANNNTIEILDYFLFKSKGDLLTIHGSDIDNYVVVDQEASVKGEASFCVQAKLMLEVVKSFPTQPLNIQVDVNTGKMMLHSEQGEYELAILDGKNYSERDEISNMEEDSKGLVTSGKAVMEGLDICLFATSNDVMRPLLCGVNFKFNDNGLVIATTNGHKLARYTNGEEKFIQNYDFTLTKKATVVLKQMLGNEENDTVEILFDNDVVCFKTQTGALYANRIEGAYPNLENVLPKPENQQMIVDKSMLLSSLKRMTVFADKSNFRVQMDISNNSLTLNTHDEAYSNKAKEVMPCQFDGAFQISFPANNFIETLQHIPSNEVLIDLTESYRPALLQPIWEEEKPDLQLDFIVMPIT